MIQNINEQQRHFLQEKRFTQSKFIIPSIRFFFPRFNVCFYNGHNSNSNLNKNNELVHTLTNSGSMASAKAPHDHTWALARIHIKWFFKEV